MCVYVCVCVCVCVCEGKRRKLYLRDSNHVIPRQTSSWYRSRTKASVNKSSDSAGPSSPSETGPSSPSETGLSSCLHLSQSANDSLDSDLSLLHSQEQCDSNDISECSSVPDSDYDCQNGSDDELSPVESAPDMMQWNGRHGCTFCLDEGTQISRGTYQRTGTRLAVKNNFFNMLKMPLAVFLNLM